MGKGKGHVPLRTCIACGRKRPRATLERYVRDADGWVVRDLRRDRPGRGAYVCPSADCRCRLSEPKRLERAFRDRCRIGVSLTADESQKARGAKGQRDVATPGAGRADPEPPEPWQRTRGASEIKATAGEL